VGVGGVGEMAVAALEVVLEGQQQQNWQQQGEK